MKNGAEDKGGCWLFVDSEDGREEAKLGYPVTDQLLEGLVLGFHSPETKMDARGPHFRFISKGRLEMDEDFLQFNVFGRSLPKFAQIFINRLKQN